MYLNSLVMGVALLQPAHYVSAAPHPALTTTASVASPLPTQPEITPVAMTDGNPIVAPCGTYDYSRLNDPELAMQCCLNDCSKSDVHGSGLAGGRCYIICSTSIGNETSVLPSEVEDGNAHEMNDEIDDLFAFIADYEAADKANGNNELGVSDNVRPVDTALDPKLSEPSTVTQPKDTEVKPTTGAPLVRRFPDEETILFCNRKCRTAMPSMPCKLDCYKKEEEKKKHQ